MENSAPLPGTILTTKDWEDKYWADGQDPYFHVRGYHDTIVRFYGDLFRGQETGRVFIPLCGKTLDLIYFAEKGHEVVGLEFSETAILGFFRDNKLTFTKKTLTGDPFVVYKVKEMNITLYQGNFYDMRTEICGLFDVIWDRGGFVAINEDDRLRYSDLMFTLMKPSTRYLLQSLNYDGSQFAGPPHYVTDESLCETFGRKCSLKILEQVSDFSSHVDTVYLISMK